MSLGSFEGGGLAEGVSFGVCCQRLNFLVVLHLSQLPKRTVGNVLTSEVLMHFFCQGWILSICLQKAKCWEQWLGEGKGLWSSRRQLEVSLEERAVVGGSLGSKGRGFLLSIT